jgi:hypothetical protein
MSDNENIGYPDVEDEDLQYKLYKKREFYYNRIKDRPNLDNYDDIKEYRDELCGPFKGLKEYQTLLANYINPETPYRGLLVFWGVGAGKTLAGVSIAEKFKPMVQKYNTKIYILVPGQLLKENWKNAIIDGTGETYLKYQDKTVYMDEEEKERQRKLAMANVAQYYKFMSYKSFHKRVLGEKIIERKEESDEDKKKVKYRKTDEGEFERDVAVDRLYNLNNSIILIDEAHNITGNEYGDSLKFIIKNSVNLRVVLLTATPMKNLADDIIELINFIRPIDAPMVREKVFTVDKNYDMDFREDGLKYLKNMTQGYVSHVRGADPLTYAKRIDKGEVPKGLKFTKLIRCEMKDFQQQVYTDEVKNIDLESEEEQKGLAVSENRRSEAVVNFVYPGLSEDKKLKGYFGREGINTLKNQLKTNYDLLNKKIGEMLKKQDENDFIYLTEDGKTITGKIFKKENLKYFSTKFYEAYSNIEKLVAGNKGARSAFVYSNLVTSGISIFQQILLQNGYLEFQEDGNYQIKKNTVCYYCGKKHEEHDNSENSDIDSDSSLESLSSEKANSHKFRPATFFTVTGKSAEEALEAIPEEQSKIINKYFNDIENKDGRNIKLILGSKVMNEGISLKNVSEVHILDTYYNFGRVDQVIGRAIRYCSHYKLMTDEERYPKVDVYKYVVKLSKGLSVEEQLYQKAEAKYLLIKKTERALKEIAIDCPLNVQGNMFNEEIDHHKDCKTLDLSKEEKDTCPLLCDFTKCHYKCENAKLNAQYYDPNRRMYRKLVKGDLDMSTFNSSLARNEIEIAKKKIKEMYLKRYVYTIHNILDYVKKNYDKNNIDLFDEFFVYKALDELIPISENDFNNYKDTILDKYNRPGYIIYVNKYYIFQPFTENEDVPMYYRTTYEKPNLQQLSLYNYIRTMAQSESITREEQTDEIEDKRGYDFENLDVVEYYDNREEFKYVGVIDKEASRGKSKKTEELEDVFKLRERRPKVVDKKRATGLQSLYGKVCSTSYTSEYLEKVANYLGLEFGKEARIDICNKIRDKLLVLEKYSLGKEKMTYMMIPKNHPQYTFPYNLEDRKNYVLKKIKENVKLKISIDVKEIKKEKGKLKYREYIITLKDSDKINEYEKILNDLGFTREKDNRYILEIN